MQLVNQQLRRGGGGQGYAAKSLCRIAQRAKVTGLHSLQLEWMERAVEIAPSDGWAHGQAADAYLYYGRLDEAARELALAEKCGERRYAQVGRARILRLQCRYEDALALLQQVKQEFEGDENEAIAWANEAEVLRDMWRFQDALEIYDQAVRKFQDEPVVRCGRAAVIADLGRYREAIEAYTRCIVELGPDEFSLNGRTHIRLELGNFDDAMSDYEEAVKRFPQSVLLPGAELPRFAK
jgi:protein O-GlcNAc transferase